VVITGVYSGHMSDRKSATRRSREAVPGLEDAPVVVSVGIRDLRDNLSRYLDLVRAGTNISITDHGRPIAAIVPMRFSAHALELAEQGLVRLPRLPKGNPADFPRIEVQGGTQDLIDWAKGEQVP
jgi:prevent-host-death family protein